MQLVNEQYILNGRTINVRREDLSFRAEYPESRLPFHGKMGAIKRLLFMWQRNEQVKKVSCFASSGSNWALGFAQFCALMNISARVYVGGRGADWTSGLESFGTEVVHLRPNHIEILSAQAKAYSEADGYRFIPFGFETPIAMKYLFESLSFDEGVSLVLCAGSGVTLACVLERSVWDHKRFKGVHAVSSGRSAAKIIKTVTRNTTASLGDFSVIENPSGYNASESESVWPTHPFYERKAYDWLVKNLDALPDPIWFLNM